MQPPSALPPFNASNDLFLELGVPLLKRPAPNELLRLFHDHDVDRNDALDVMEVHLFLQAVSSMYGDGSWGKAGDSPAAKKKRRVVLSSSDDEDVPLTQLVGNKKKVSDGEAPTKVSQL